MTMEDLENYQVHWSEPLHTNYRGNEIYTLSLPNFGGIDLIEGIHLLEAANLSDYGHYTESPEALYKFIQITRVPFLIGPQGTRLGVSPELVKKHIPEYDLSPESRVKRKSAELIWAKIESPEWPVLRKEALEMRMEASTAIGQVLKDLRKPDHSDGVVVFDEMGNVAAMIHSINAAYWGTSGIFVDGVSIPDSGAHQQGLIKEVGPGGRMPDPTHPLIVLKDGEPVLAGGTIGSLGLLGATMQNLVNILDFGMDPKTSVDTPNFLGPELIPSESYKQVFVEGEFSEEILEAIRAMGQEVEMMPGESRGLFCGNWVGIQRDPKTGKLLGGVPHWLKGIAEGYN